MAWTNEDRHKILRDAYRNYLTFEAFVSQTGKDVIEYAVETQQKSGKYVDIAICFSDLKLALERIKLSPRKEQAFYLNVIRDLKQKEVAEIMKITTVSVGQYVDAAMMQLAEWYFASPEERRAIEANNSVHTDING